MRTHHDKHHAAYVKSVNAALETSGDKPDSLEQLVAQSAAAGDKALFNPAGQAWNHGFFWECMTAQHRGPQGPLLEAIKASGGLDALKENFVKQAVGHFGSGWAWLMADGAQLSVITTHDAGSGLQHPGAPILVCDVWEHAYYLDHKNDRAAFLAAWWDKLANWSFAETQFAAATGTGSLWRYPPPVADARSQAVA